MGIFVILKNYSDLKKFNTGSFKKYLQKIFEEFFNKIRVARFF
jgi:hypothetical protein